MQDDHDELRVPRELDGQEKGPRRTSKRTANRLGLSRDHRFDYKNTAELTYFITERGKLVPARVSGLSALHGDLALAVKRARSMALLPFTKGQP